MAQESDTRMLYRQLHQKATESSPFRSLSGRRQRQDIIRRLNRNRAPELGALKLDADEVAEFEEWMTGPNEPNALMSAAVQTHRLLRAVSVPFGTGK
jgi:hypothetical protein